MRRLGTCEGDSGGGWKAPLGRLTEGVYLCLVYKFSSTSGSLDTSFIFWSTNSHWGLSGLTLRLGWMDELENNLCGFSFRPLESNPGLDLHGGFAYNCLLKVRFPYTDQSKNNKKVGREASQADDFLIHPDWWRAESKFSPDSISHLALITSFNPNHLPRSQLLMPSHGLW